MNLPGVEYGTAQRFTFRQRVVLRVVPCLGSLVAKCILATCRYVVRGKHHYTEAAAAGPVLIAIFHESALFAPYHFRHTNFHGMTSQSFDGELAARLLRHFGIGAVRGSSTRGGSEALKNIAIAMQHVGTVGFTIDGPKGPWRTAKPGMSVLAARTGRPVAPMAFAATRAKRLRTWDRFPIPLPFSRIYMLCGPPIPPPATSSAEDIERHRQHLEAVMNALHREVDAEANPDKPPLPPEHHDAVS